MSYAEITFKDKNPIKRWLQNYRLISAIKLYCPQQSPETICDFGAGNGELCKLLAVHHPNAKLTCYEPTPRLLSEAEVNLRDIANIEFCQATRNIVPGTLDSVFCLEVFEHLPPKETSDALQTIYDLLKPGGKIIIGVPVEIGIPSLYKGFFRMSRRYGAFDACIKNIGLSFIGRPPKNRQISEICPGFNYYSKHMGFNFNNLKKNLQNYFTLNKISASPYAILGWQLMPEIYFVAEKANHAIKRADNSISKT